jgi:ATP-dependent Lon protease
VAVERVTAGLLKILHPDGSATDSEVQRLASYAVEYRQRVHDQLSRMAPGEFKGKKIAFEGLVPTASLDAAPPGSEAIERYDRLNHEAAVGEATGLATVRDGDAAFGDLIVVEAALVPGKGEVTVVGGRGKILRESVKAAFQYVRSHAVDLGIAPTLLDGSKLALHLLHIAEEREGPSAGVTFVTAMVSAATRRPVRPALAMTGEVSLLGKVTEVGGLPQKLEAAARAGRKTVIIPRANAADVSAVPDEILDQLEVIPVESVEELLAAALEASPRQPS